MMAVRMVFCTVVFLVGAFSTRLLQGVAWLFFSGVPQWYYAFIEVLKVHFLVLITFITSIVSPCKFEVSYHKNNLPETTNFRLDGRGNLISTLSPNSVFISNHQLYTDWMFIWFLSYTANLAHGVYVVVKEQLVKAPIVGQGMLNFRFLFLLRKWEDDKIRMTNQLLEIDAEARGFGPALAVQVVASSNSKAPGIKVWPAGHSKKVELLHPYHLFIFPEGTVVAKHTRDRSDKYIAELGQAPLKHVLFPRVRGLFLALRLLRHSVDVVYDVTFGYSGLKAEDYGEDIYTLKAMFLMGNGPRKISSYIRSFAVKDIPLGDDDSIVDIDQLDPNIMKEFEQWLFKVWYEKDQLMAKFFETGAFVDDDDLSAQKIVADFKTRSVWENLSPFITLGCLVLMCYWAVVLIKRAIS